MVTVIIPMANRVIDTDIFSAGTVPAVETFLSMGLNKVLKNTLDNTRLIFAISPEAEKLHAAEVIHWQIPEAEICVIENTTSEPDTVAQVIEKMNVTGDIFVKDCNTVFDSDRYREGGNFISVADLNDLPFAFKPSRYSYVKIDEMDTISAICEKKVISNYFCAGGYGFDDAQKFVKIYQHLKSLNMKSFYISHIIYYMLLRGETFVADKQRTFLII